MIHQQAQLCCGHMLAAPVEGSDGAPQKAEPHLGEAASLRLEHRDIALCRVRMA